MTVTEGEWNNATNLKRLAVHCQDRNQPARLAVSGESRNHRGNDVLTEHFVGVCLSFGDDKGNHAVFVNNWSVFRDETDHCDWCPRLADVHGLVAIRKEGENPRKDIRVSPCIKLSRLKCKTNEKT